MRHFDNFRKPCKQICEIDNELCCYTEASGWDVRYYMYLPYNIAFLSATVSFFSLSFSSQATGKACWSKTKSQVRIDQENN